MGCIDYFLLLIYVSNVKSLQPRGQSLEKSEHLRFDAMAGVTHRPGLEMEIRTRLPSSLASDLPYVPTTDECMTFLPKYTIHDVQLPLDVRSESLYDASRTYLKTRSR